MKKTFLSLCIILLISMQSLFAQSLKITEVFVDGTDEWLEITNTWPSDFIWPLSIDGVKSSTLTIPSRTIPSLQSLIIGDNLSMVTNLGSLTTLTAQWLSMIDTNAIAITLSSNSTVLDSFSITQSQVQSYDNTKTSFMSLYTIGSQSWSPLASLTTYNANNSGWFTINPWQAYTDQGWLVNPIAITTGSISTWSTTGNSTNIDCNSVQSGRVDVTELHRWAIYTPYIEIVSQQDRQGSLTLSGNGLTQSITIPSRTWEQNTRYLITATTSGLLHTSNVIVIAWRWLQQTGVIALSKNGTDTLGYILIDNGWQTLHSSTSYNCLKAFDTVISPSPWFASEFLGYANIQTITQNNTCNTGSTSWTGSWTGTIYTGGQVTGYNRVIPWTVKITKIDYDPPGSDTNNEVIGYTLTGSTGLNLSGRVLTYDGKTKILGNIALIPWQESLVTGNYTLVNSRAVCISLWYGPDIIDTACYDPNDNPSPFIPWQWSGQISTWWNIGTTWLDDDILSNTSFAILGLVYDPPWDDTHNESVTIQMLAGSWTINLSSRRLRVGTRNKTIQWTISSWQTLTLIGNFQMSNSNATCVALVYDERVYDEYCYNPSTPTNNTNTNTPTNDMLYNQRTISFVSWSMIYDPPWSDENNESFSLLMTGGQQAVDLSKLTIRINGGSKKKLSGMLTDNTPLHLVGTRWLPNSRPSCIDLMEWNHIFDSYCYDPLSWTTELDKVDTLSTGSKLTGGKDSSKLISQLSQLRLAWILPNPLGKDIARSEQIAFRRSGENITITNNKYIKVIVGKSSISLSWLSLDGDIVSFASPKALTNQAACVSLVIYNPQTKLRQEQDKFCYPQSKEWVIYYHPAYKPTTTALSLETMKALSDDAIDLSQLSLKKQAKNICLIYNKQTIRCMAWGSSSQHTQDKTKLANAYIRLASDLLTSNDIATLRSLTNHYKTLNKALSNKKTFLTVQGYRVSTTDLERYHALVSAISDEAKNRETVARDLWWQQVVNDRYRLLRSI